LAERAYGSNYHGEVKRPEVAEETTEAEETEEVAEVEAEAETEEETTEESTEEEEEQPITSFSDLVESQEWDPEWSMTLEVPIKVDGRESTAKISDLVASYQTQEAANKNLEEAKEKGRLQTQQLTEKQEQLDSQINIAAALIQDAEKLLESDIAKADLDRLERDDPALFSAEKLKFQERRQAIEAKKQEAVRIYTEAAQANQAELQKTQTELARTEQEKLYSALKWNDSEESAADRKKLGNYILSQGISEEELAGTLDHRIYVMAHKAMQFDEGKAKISTAEKKVAKIPKAARPKGPKPQDQIQRDNYQEKLNRLKQTGNLDDAFAVMKARNVL
jgi:hypothetical protein